MALFPALAALALIGVLALVVVVVVQRRAARTRHGHLEDDVADRNAQLVELTRHLLTAREDERHRLARDLHDELGALLTSAKLDAARMRSRLAGGAPEVLERLTHLVGTLDAVIALKRRIIEDLRPSALSHLGLVVTLEILLREFSERSGLKVHTALSAVPLRPEAELVVYRMVQEAINNIAKHARARQVWVTLALHKGQVQIGVRDDGTGFDSRLPPRSAFGLAGMRFRIEAEYGALQVTSLPGQGTSIEATLPAAPAPALVAAQT